MTITHAYQPGTPENPGHIYYEQQGAWLRCELEPEDVIAALDAHMETGEEGNPPSGRIWREEGMWVAEFEIDGRGPIGAQAETIKELFWRMAAIAMAEDKEKPLPAADPTPESGWSAWLNWAGGECPLPPDTGVECETANGDKTPEGRCVEARWWEWERRDSGSDIARFRYREDAPGGWVARPKGWVPPASLWAEGSPVRCILRTDNTECDLKAPPAHWDGFTHIRLLPRAPASEPAPEMPEGFEVAEDGALRSEVGTMISRYEIDRYGPDTIRAAVEAWLKEMERR